MGLAKSDTDSTPLQSSDALLSWIDTVLCEPSKHADCACAVAETAELLLLS